MQKICLLQMNVVVTLLFSACSFSEPLSCSSERVKASTIELVMDQVRDVEANHYIVKTPGVGRALLHNDVATRKMLVTGDIGYQDIVNANNSPKVQAILDAVDAEMKKYQVQLNAIRTTAKDEEVGIVHCEAKVDLKNEETQAALSIEYQVQPTDDGDLYIEMTRLF